MCCFSPDYLNRGEKKGTKKTPLPCWLFFIEKEHYVSLCYPVPHSRSTSYRSFIIWVHIGTSREALNKLGLLTDSLNSMHRVFFII